MLADEYCDIARGLLALLMMMIYWLLAGFDVLENPNPSELSSPAARLADHGQTAKPSGDFVHYPNHSKLYYFRFCGVASGPLLTGSTAPWLKPDKLCNSAVLSSIAGIAPTEFLNSHSGPPCLNRRLAIFALPIVRESCRLSAAYRIRASRIQKRNVQPFYHLGPATIQKEHAFIPNAGSN